MDRIELSGKQYPIRFDFRALREFKAMTGNDVLKNFDAKDTENIIKITYCAIKSGYFFENPSSSEFVMTDDDIARAIAFKDMSKVVSAFMEEVRALMRQSSPENSNSDPDKPGEELGIG